VLLDEHFDFDDRRPYDEHFDEHDLDLDEHYFDEHFDYDSHNLDFDNDAYVPTGLQHPLHRRHSVL
jgi:hypothetical protein